MKFKLSFITLFIGFLLTAQDFDRAKMDSLFHIIETNNKGMGSISLFHNGKEVYQNSYGFASIEDDIPASESTKYRIGSVSKTFTATVIMKLVEEKKLTLDTRLNTFFPQIGNAENITVKNLLNHRSGIFNLTNAPDYLEWNTQNFSRQQLLDKLVSGGNVFEPDERTEYSNSNYMLLTFIAEDVTKKTYSQLIEKYITKPAGLKNTYVGKKTDLKNNESFSYTFLSDWTREAETDMSVPLGAGAIVSTPKDLNIFMHQLFNGKLVSAASLETMQTLKDGFGLGLFAVPFYEHTGYGHTGGIDGFHANAFYFPKEGFSVAFLSNGVSFPMNSILIGVLSIYFGKDYDLPEFTEALVLTSEELDKYLGVYSSPGFPLKVTISKNDNVLIGQATGQPSFPLEAYGQDKFQFAQAMLKLEFNTEENTMLLKQGGNEFELKRE